MRDNLQFIEDVTTKLEEAILYYSLKEDKDTTLLCQAAALIMRWRNDQKERYLPNV